MRNLLGVNRLLKYIVQKKHILIFIIFIAVIVSGWELIPAQIVGRIVDSLPQSDINIVLKWVAVFGLVYFVANVLKLLFGKLVMDFNNGIIEDVRKDIFKSTIHHDVKVTEPDISGDILTRTTGDIEQITKVIAGPLNGLLGRMLVFIFSIIVLGRLDIKYIFIAIIVSAGLYTLSKNVSEKNKETGVQERKIIGGLSSYYSDIMRNIFLIKAYVKEKNEIHSLDTMSDNILLCRKKQMSYMTKYWASVEFCNCIGYVVAFLVCVYEVKRGSYTVGQLVVIYSYLQTIFSSMVNVSRYRTDIYNADASLNRVFPLIDDQVSGKKLSSLPKSGPYSIEKIELKNISVMFDHKEIIKNISFVLEKGTITVLAADSGKGKSTIINAMLGFADIANGCIMFDGQDVTNNSTERRNAIRVCFQKAYLQQKSLYENIYYGGEKPNWIYLFYSVIESIMKKKGDDVILENTNNSLSGGEARRVALARTVNKKVPCYIFDEPTAELDDYNKQMVIESIKKLSKNAMILVATHDNDLITAADQIITL